MVLCDFVKISNFQNIRFLINISQIRKVLYRLNIVLLYNNTFLIAYILEKN